MAKNVRYVVGTHREIPCSTHKSKAKAYKAFLKCNADQKGHKIWKLTTVDPKWERVYKEKV